MIHLTNSGIQLDNDILKIAIQKIVYHISIIQWYAYDLAIANKNSLQINLDRLVKKLRNSNMKNYNRALAYYLVAMLNLIIKNNHIKYKENMRMTSDITEQDKLAYKIPISLTNTASFLIYLSRLSSISEEDSKRFQDLLEGEIRLLTKNKNIRSIKETTKLANVVINPNKNYSKIITCIENLQQYVGRDTYNQILSFIIPKLNGK
jgi:hypothetical protein